MHETVTAMVKMKWKKTGEQMDVKKKGSAFKVQAGERGRVVSLNPIKVEWPTTTGLKVGIVREAQVVGMGDAGPGLGGLGSSSRAAPAPQTVSGGQTVQMGARRGSSRGGTSGASRGPNAEAGGSSSQQPRRSLFAGSRGRPQPGQSQTGSSSGAAVPPSGRRSFFG